MIASRNPFAGLSVPWLHEPKRRRKSRDRGVDRGSWIADRALGIADRAFGIADRTRIADRGTSGIAEKLRH